jgi:outer membrane beta-barrel protein
MSTGIFTIICRMHLFMKSKLKPHVIFFLFILFITDDVFGALDSVYDFSWIDQDKEIFVLQNRKYRKDSTFHVNLGSGLTTNGPFVDAYHGVVKSGYFFTENFGLEGMYFYNQGSENDTFTSVQNNGTGGAGSTPFRRIVDNYYGAMFLWSPFYAKINTFNSILYFDWMIGAGYARMTEHNNREALQNLPNPEDIESVHNCLSLATAMQFYLSETFAIRLDLTTLYYQAQKGLTNATANDQITYSNYDVSLSIGSRF